MPRNFGLSARNLPRTLAPGANAGASFFTWKAAAKGVFNRLCKRDRASAQPVAARVNIKIRHDYRRVFVIHDWKNCTQTLSPSHPVEVKS